MSVLRRIFAMRAAHAGWPGPGLPRLVESGDLVDCHRGAVLAQLAPPLAEPVDQLLARGADRDRGGVGDDRAPVLPAGVIPPNRATRSVLPSRCCLASKQVRSPSLVMTLALWRAAILVTVDLCLAARVFSIDVSAFQRSVLQPPDVLGEQVVVHDAPVFGSVDPHDVVVVQVLEPGPVPGFALAAGRGRTWP